ncbi:hypothetical protein CIHG_02261 [Coccidioides immitis H538.4]|uniref:Uncharacterized protein n=3 Tax=Coccidioides immitis TaxID=5501 RepID=A0A0J8R737_COCIT|nr:hypothetical protein CIRG_00432 [Coccidioides immitis RMSCC 2394]KMU80651.1 hypothetical protein CISG_08640 [Coccidioides immitis RMSCC 3703]KMU84477.1 hypothetical protein CIHG_02261 [Coccidioides immitis H538.4]
MAVQKSCWIDIVDDDQFPWSKSTLFKNPGHTSVQPRKVQTRTTGATGNENTNWDIPTTHVASPEFIFSVRSNDEPITSTASWRSISSDRSNHEPSRSTLELVSAKP